MMIRDIRERTLIGLHAKIVAATQESDVGIQGLIVDETRDTIVIGEDERRRTQKKDITLDVDIEGESITINGSDLVGLPEERIKKIR